MEENKVIKPINLGEISKKLWAYRKTYFIVLPIVFVLTYLITICIPRYYQCKVSLAPEGARISSSGTFGSLASSFGLGSSLSKGNSTDAIVSEIYPDVIKSKNFVAELMSVEVENKDGNIRCNYYTYLRDHQKQPWWSSLRGTVEGWFKTPSRDTANGTEKLDVRHLTKIQDDIFSCAIDKITCTVDKKTDVVTITIQDQDPQICATIADSTCKKLQEFIVAYRTNKARIDYEYYKKLCEESKAEYEEALRKYAAYADANQHTVMAKYKVKLESMENELQEKYTLYTSINNQMQNAAAKLQEATPAFTVIESASVPVKPAGPKRVFMSIVMMMLSFFVLSGWILVRNK